MLDKCEESCMTLDRKRLVCVCVCVCVSLCVQIHRGSSTEQHWGLELLYSVGEEERGWGP